MKAEHILAVEGSLFGNCSPDGPSIRPMVPCDFDNANLFLVQRERAENDESYRHVIPYTVIFNDKGQVLGYQRGCGAGEQRLAGQKSIGFGGHVDLNDVRFAKNVIDFDRTISDAGYRELSEEISIYQHDIAAIETLGLILDDSNPVGRVHLGILQRATYISNKRVNSREKEITMLGWLDLSDIDPDEFEGWSSAAIRFLRGDEVPTEQEAIDNIDSYSDAHPLGIDDDEVLAFEEVASEAVIVSVSHEAKKPGFFNRLFSWAL